MDTPRVAARSTVLLVEDDEALVALIRDVLVAEGFEVVVATRGDAAIASLEGSRVDVALLDKELPGTNGLDLVAYLAARHPGLPTILMTAFGGTLVARAAQERGAAMYLDKPVRLDTLVAAVQAAADGRSVPSGSALRPAPAATPDGRGVADRGARWAAVLVRPEAARLGGFLGPMPPRPPGTAGRAPAAGLLRATLARMALVTAPEHTVVVSGARQAREVVATLAQIPGAHPLLEPADRGSAVATLYAAHWIAWRDPEAIVVAVPHGHAVAGADALRAAVERACAFLGREGGRLVLLGAPAASPEADGGWIVPAEPLDDGEPPIRAVGRLVETPSRGRARALVGAGALHSTSILIARASVLRDVGRQLLSRLHRGLVHAVALDGSEAGRQALRRTYRLVPPASLSGAVLQDSKPLLAVLPVEGVGWGDWGRPRRAIRALPWLGTAPPGRVASSDARPERGRWRS
jgi:mannose-1-phosphate guanylyltransferase